MHRLACCCTGGLSGGLKDSARRPFQGPIRPPIVNSRLSEEEEEGDICQALLTRQVAPVGEGLNNYTKPHPTNLTHPPDKHTGPKSSLPPLPEVGWERHRSP